MIENDIISLSPAPVIDRAPIDRGEVAVVREDLLPGGTKQRALLPYLREAIGSGARCFVYASPAPGFAQVALAHVCAILGIRCVVFCARIGGVLHEYSELARSHGAEVRSFDSLPESEAAASACAAPGPGRRKLPLGFGDERFVGHYRDSVREVWESLTADLGRVPPRVWTPVGSGTLARALRAALPPRVVLACVDVRVLGPGDDRLRALAQLPEVLVHRAPQPFVEPCADPTPVPSNAHYDAKVWQFVRVHGSDGDLWWNVAR